MATVFPINVEVDVAEPRIELDSLTLSAGGRKERQSWDLNISSGVWRDPARRRVMLAPLCTTAAWRTTTTGNYARLAKTDYTLTTGASWVENHRGVSGNIYLEANGTNERVVTATSWSANQPFFVSVYIPGVQSLGEQTIFECGWGTYGGGTTVSLRFRANGSVAAYIGSTQVAYSDLDYAAAKTDAFSKSVGLSTVNLMLMPTRRRDPAGNVLGGEILIVSDAGDAMVIGLPNLASSDAITPAGTFYWQVPIGRPSVLLAPLRFETAGTLYGPEKTLRYAPITGQTFSGRAYYATIGASPSATYSVVDSTLTAYTADGIIDDVRGKIALSGDGTNTVCVEAVDWYMVPTVVDTDDSEMVDITEAIEDMSLRMDDRGVVAVTIVARRNGLADLGGYLYASDRPIRIYLTHPDTSAEIDLFRGVLFTPTWEPADGAGDGDQDRIIFEGQDRSYEIEQYQYGDTIADDGKEIDDAIEDIFVGCGFDPGDLIISSTSAKIAQSSEIPLGEFAMLPQRGTTRAEHLDRIFDEYAANWWRGWTPTSTDGYIYRAQSPTDLSSTPVLYLFECEEDALTYGYTAAQARLRTIRKIVRHGISPEANQVIVLGQNPYSGAGILSQDNDTASQTPDTAPSSRPVTWRGRIHRVLSIDPSITTQAVADTVQGVLFDRLSNERYLVDITCPFLVLFSTGDPMWIGGVVRLYLPGGVDYEDYRILSVPRIDFPAIATPAQLSAGRPVEMVADYRMERIVDSGDLPSTSDTTYITADSTAGTADAA